MNNINLRQKLLPPPVKRVVVASDNVLVSEVETCYVGFLLESEKMEGL